MLVLKHLKFLPKCLVVHELMTELEMDYTIVPPIVWKATFKIAGKGVRWKRSWLKSTC